MTTNRVSNRWIIFKTKLNFKVFVNDPCLLIINPKNKFMTVIFRIYVDELFFVVNKDKIEDFISNIEQILNLKRNNNVNEYVGFEI